MKEQSAKAQVERDKDELRRKCDGCESEKEALRNKIKQLEAAAAKPRMVLGAAAPVKRKAGVGLLLGKFESDHHHSDKIFILQIVPGGAAETNSEIEVNDILHSVNGVRVEAKELDDVFSLVQGEEGTAVSMELEKPEQQKLYEVSLKRKYIANLMP